MKTTANTSTQRCRRVNAKFCIDNLGLWTIYAIGVMIVLLQFRSML